MQKIMIAFWFYSFLSSWHQLVFLAGLSQSLIRAHYFLVQRACRHNFLQPFCACLLMKLSTSCYCFLEAWHLSSHWFQSALMSFLQAPLQLHYWTYNRRFRAKRVDSRKSSFFIYENSSLFCQWPVWSFLLRSYFLLLYFRLKLIVAAT